MQKLLHNAGWGAHSQDMT